MVSGDGFPQILSNTISNNSWTSGDGGGIALWGAGSPSIMNNLVSNNLASGIIGCIADIPCTTAVATGGGLLIFDSSPSLVQNLIINNTADIGGGISYEADAYQTDGPLMVNNTVAGNTATQNYGSAVFAWGASTSEKLINNIFVAADASNTFYCVSGEPVFLSNDVFGARGVTFEGNCSSITDVAGNITVDPLFAEPASGDYRLTAGSPAIDAGANDAPDLLSLDFYGNPRIVADYPGCPAVVDLGIAEYQPAGTAPATCPGPPPPPSMLRTSSRALSFGKTRQFTSSKAKKLSVTNPRQNRPTAISLALSGPFEADFRVEHNCPHLLDSGAKCSLMITFTPFTDSKESARLVLLNGSNTSIATVKLSGQGFCSKGCFGDDPAESVKTSR